MSLTFGPLAGLLDEGDYALSHDADGYCLEPDFLAVVAEYGNPAAPVTAPLDLADLPEFADPAGTSPVGLRVVQDDERGAA